MKSWKRITPFNTYGKTEYLEEWTCYENDKVLEAFDVHVKIGKPLDVMGLKNLSIDEIKDYAAFLKATAKKLYGQGQATRSVEKCPCCRETIRKDGRTFKIIDILYAVCPNCGHGFVASQPTEDALETLFRESGEHSGTYVDKESIEIRLSQVLKPKFDWMMNVFRNQWHRAPETILDVGAGGGHFVELCRRNALDATGYELSAASISFAKEAFGLELENRDFLSQSDKERFDIVTFWGLLEYTPHPGDFIQRAAQKMSENGGLLVVEIPRLDCFGSAIQQDPGATIARHLDPTSHVNCFSDLSLLSVLSENGFKPLAAWYFGMDVYEVLTQLAIRMDDAALMENAAELIPALQQCADSGKLCDDLIVAAVPI